MVHCMPKICFFMTMKWHLLWWTSENFKGFYWPIFTFLQLSSHCFRVIFMVLKLSWKLFCVSSHHLFIALKTFHGILRVRKQLKLHTMNFQNAKFMALKIEITAFSWLVHVFFFLNKSWFHSDVPKINCCLGNGEKYYWPQHQQIINLLH